DVQAGELKLPSNRIMTHAVDLRDGMAVEGSAQAVSKKFGRVDGLIHLVGGWVGGKTFAESSEGDFDAMLGQHAWTTYHLLRAYTTHLISNQWGRVLIISATTIASPAGKAAAYSAAKAAQENLILSLAAEVKGTGVTANVIQVRAIDVKNEGKGATP